MTLGPLLATHSRHHISTATLPAAIFTFYGIVDFFFISNSCPICSSGVQMAVTKSQKKKCQTTKSAQENMWHSNQMSAETPCIAEECYQ